MAVSTASRRTVKPLKRVDIVFGQIYTAINRGVNKMRRVANQSRFDPHLRGVTYDAKL